MTQQQTLHTRVPGEFANGLRGRVQAVKDGRRAGRIQHHTVEDQQVGRFGNEAVGGEVGWCAACEQSCAGDSIGPGMDELSQIGHHIDGGVQQNDQQQAAGARP